MSSRLLKLFAATVVAAVLVSIGAGPAAAAPPANDDFSAAQVIGPALPITVPASTVEATAQPLEPNVNGNPAVRTVWFRWTAPAAGPVVVDLCDAGFTGSSSPFERFAVWTGAALNALTEVEAQSGECLLRFTAVAGTVYSVQVDYGNDQGTFTFRMRPLAPPANDNFASATVIGPALPVTLPSTNLDSTHQVGEPPFLGGASGSRSVWYRWTAPSTGQVRVNVCDFEAISGAANKAVAAYTGAAIGALVPVASTNNCELSFVANAGTTYSLAFSAYISGEGTFTFNLKDAPPPANDDFVKATTVGPGLPVTLQASNEFSSVEAGEPGHGGLGGTPAHSSWFNWTPTQNARVRIRACGRDFGARLGVYTGAAVNALTPVGDPPPYGPHCSKLLDAVAGTTYRIAAAGAPFDGGYGTYELDIHVLDVPTNDLFADAATLSDRLPTTVQGSTVDATYETGEPYHAPDYGNQTASVWYRWTARSDDAIILSACSQGEPNRIAVYSGTTLTGLDQIATADEGCRDGTKGGRLAIAPVAGETYLIAVAAAVRDFESPFTLATKGPAVTPPVKPPVIDPPRNGFNLKKAIKKCKKIKSQRKRRACIRKAKRTAAIARCKKIKKGQPRKVCIKKARKRFR